MRLLTDGKVIVMIFGDKPSTYPVPLWPEHVNKEMDWEEQNPEITSISQIKKKWPYLFDRDNLMYIPNLQFVEIYLKLYQLHYMNYLDGTNKKRPHFIDKEHLKILE